MITRVTPALTNKPARRLSIEDRLIALFERLRRNRSKG